MRIGRQQERRDQHGQQVRFGKALVGGGCVAALGFGPSAAMAAPGSGVSGTVVAKGTSTGKLKVKTPKGRTDVTFRTITVEPGGSTGWHTHSGQVIAVVQSGTLTRILDDCSVEVMARARRSSSRPAPTAPTSDVTWAPSRSCSG